MLNDDFLMNIGNPVANVYSKKASDDYTTYLIKVEFPKAGIYFNGLKLVLYEAETGQYKVYCPSSPNPEYRTDKKKKPYISHCEFDTNSLFWDLIEGSCLQAVEYADDIEITRQEKENNHDDEIIICAWR